ncbi:hypothetical protein HanIR_Chr09g0401771 [Helianthus annuus]|nr:hypothetical protein HanIR_Chr09g0401771 [Helianthus annuus]
MWAKQAQGEPISQEARERRLWCRNLYQTVLLVDSNRIVCKFER